MLNSFTGSFYFFLKQSCSLPFTSSALYFRQSKNVLKTGYFGFHYYLMPISHSRNGPVSAVYIGSNG